MLLKCNLRVKLWKSIGARLWLSAIALAVLIPLATAWLCESGFGTLLSIKTKSINRLNAQSDMRAAISNTVPRFESLISMKQEQESLS